MSGSDPEDTGSFNESGDFSGDNPAFSPSDKVLAEADFSSGDSEPERNWEAQGAKPKRRPTNPKVTFAFSFNG